MEYPSEVAIAQDLDFGFRGLDGARSWFELMLVREGSRDSRLSRDIDLARKNYQTL